MCQESETSLDILQMWSGKNFINISLISICPSWLMGWEEQGYLPLNLKMMDNTARLSWKSWWLFFFFIRLHHVFFNILLSVCHFTLIVQDAWWRVPFQSTLRLLSLGKTTQTDGWNSMISTPVTSILTIHTRGKTQTGVSQFCSSPVI